MRTSAGSSGKLSDSDIFAITHAEAADPCPTQALAQPALVTELAVMRDVAQLRDSKRAVEAGLRKPATRIQDKSLKALAQAAADSPAHKAPSALQQLRALAGSAANSPATPMQPKTVAQGLKDVAGIPLSEWHSSAGRLASATAAHVHTSRTPARSGDSLVSSTSAGVGWRSPGANWGALTPPQPVNLNIKVLGDSPSADALRGSDGLYDLGSQIMTHSRGHQVKAGSDAPAGALDAGTTTEALSADHTMGRHGQGSLPANHHEPALDPQSVPGALHGVHSAGADELTAAMAGATGSPWDPQQGPKLLESLSDFSSFNSSLSMLQQLAGKSAAGLASLGLASSPLKKKSSDKGHLMPSASAPSAWWKPRSKTPQRGFSLAAKGSGAAAGSTRGFTAAAPTVQAADQPFHPVQSVPAQPKLPRESGEAALLVAPGWSEGPLSYAHANQSRPDSSSTASVLGRPSALAQGSASAGAAQPNTWAGSSQASKAQPAAVQQRHQSSHGQQPAGNSRLDAILASATALAVLAGSSPDLNTSASGQQLSTQPNLAQLSSLQPHKGVGQYAERWGEMPSDLSSQLQPGFATAAAAVQPSNSSHHGAADASGSLPKQKVAAQSDKGHLPQASAVSLQDMHGVVSNHQNAADATAGQTPGWFVSRALMTDPGIGSPSMLGNSLDLNKVRACVAIFFDFYKSTAHQPPTLTTPPVFSMVGQGNHAGSGLN